MEWAGGLGAVEHDLILSTVAKDVLTTNLHSPPSARDCHLRPGTTLGGWE
jgi:hypothetical protein